MKKFRGYYLEEISSGSLESVRVEKRLIYHTAISPTSEAALEGALYSQEVIEAGQSFKGDIWVYDDALLSRIEGFAKNLEVFYVGSDKSTGLGRFKMPSYPEESDVGDKEELKGRILGFNKILGLDDGEIYFSVTWQSDAIITDEFMRYKTFIEPEDLGLTNTEFVHGVADNRLLQGWNAMTRLPKEDMIAIEKGSVFAFRANNLDDLLDRLHEAETMGIGKRRGEGFGRLTVCDSFHWTEDLR
jgi:CRISPR-associated Csx10 family RAMP protein